VQLNRTRTRTATSSITEQHTQPSHLHPGIMQKPGIPAQQMQRTGTRERACRSGRGQNPLVEHAQHAPQPRSIAWEGGGEAAMKGGTPCFLRESFNFIKTDGSTVASGSEGDGAGLNSVPT